ncbi:MAG: response regulator transcription factor [Solirubrobacterales bacterium]|nr:response regulator transcription factor [Solirubrobacterales bacterium]
MIRVVVVDDHELVRAGLVELLSAADDIEVVATAADGDGALATVSEHRPEVVLMDLSMPGVGGIEATRSILADQPGLRVVALTSSSVSSEVLAALDAGAIGYLLKDASPGELRDGIRAAARGESPLSPKAARAVIAARDVGQDAPELSARERQVLSCVAEGLPNKRIARRLEISEKTVKAHLTSIFQQIGVSDRTQAALWATRHGDHAQEQNGG